MDKLPSIVFITTDTQGQNMVSAYGARGEVNTPNLDRLAAQGVLFKNAVCASPVCTPARSAWYSGLHANRNGAWTNDQTMHRGLPLLADCLTVAGYRSVHLGKWHLDGKGYKGGDCPDGGFTAPWFDLASFYREHPEGGPNRYGAWAHGLEDEAFCFGHSVADKAIRVMQDADQTPLFLAVEFDEPHGPYISPPPFRGQTDYHAIWRPGTMNADLNGKPKIHQDYARFLREGNPQGDDLPVYYRHYHDCNRYVDYEIGRILDAVKAYLPADTVVIFTSDHGDHHGAFGLCAKGPTMYESTCAVPLIIKAPGVVAGLRTPALASGVDIFPTILDFAGVDRTQFRSGDGYTGLSLLPVLKGETESVREEAFMEFNRFGLGHDQDDGLFPIRCIRTRRWKLVINLFDRDEFYDLEADPEEAVNLIESAALVAQRNSLHDRLLAWQGTSHDPFRGPQWKMRPWRTDATHRFEGLFTSGYRDTWKDHDFHNLNRQENQC